MNCKKCNATLQDTDIICPNCGENVDNSVLKNHEASTVKSEEMKKLTKGDKTEEKENAKKKFNEVKKKVIIAASIVLCLVIILSAVVISSRGVVYLFATELDEKTVGMTTLLATPIADDVVGIRSSYLGLDVSQINPGAFKGTSLENVVIPASIQRIGFEAFLGCKSLKDVVIPGGMIIQYDAFRDCTSLTAVTLLEGATTIGLNAFNGCTALENVSVPSGLKSVNRNSFDNCPNLVYSKYDNGLYLGNAENPYVVLIKANSDNIESLEIHPDTKMIAASALEGYAKLVKITFNGTVEEWGKITRGANWNLNTGKYIITCTDGEIKK